MLKRAWRAAPARSPPLSHPPWRQPRGKKMVSLVNSPTNDTRIEQHLCGIDLIFAPAQPRRVRRLSRTPPPHPPRRQPEVAQEALQEVALEAETREAPGWTSRL